MKKNDNHSESQRADLPKRQEKPARAIPPTIGDAQNGEKAYANMAKKPYLTIEEASTHKNTLYIDADGNPSDKNIIENNSILSYNYEMSLRESKLYNFIKIEYNLSSGIALDLARKFHIQLTSISNKPDLSDSEQNESLRLPESAPELYGERANRRENPLQFYDRVWRKYEKSGALYLDELNKLDPKLSPAIRVYCTRFDKVAKDYLPPSSRERTLELAEKATFPP